jgi:phage regulator Rha-like protein
MSNLVTLKNNEPLTTSLIVSKELNRTHKGIIQLIREYSLDFVDFGTLTFGMRKSKGRPTEFVYLNEQHLTFLIMMLRVKQSENDKVLEFKKRITKEFFNMKKTLLYLSVQKANQEWIENREKGKISRLKETDVIKKFVIYAKNQGSENAEKYYMLLTNMENKALFFIEQKFKNLREILNIHQLDEIKQADEIVLKALIDGMAKNIDYKKIFKLAKKRVETFASLKGKSVVPSIEFKQISMLERNEKK